MSRAHHDHDGSPEGRQASLDQERRAREAAEEALRARDELVAVLAHDIRGPLHVITAATDLLVREGASGQANARWAQVIRRAAGQIERLTTDIVEAIRLESGAFALPLRRERIDLRALVREIVEGLEPVATQKRVLLASDVSASRPVVVEGDRDRLVQAIVNVAANAVRFTPPGGAVTVHARESDPGPVLSVTDTGPGIPAEHLPRIFDRGWVGQPGGGTGLGLWIARGIIEAHGGSVTAESAPGAGSTFTFGFAPPSPRP